MAQDVYSCARMATGRQRANCIIVNSLYIHKVANYRLVTFSGEVWWYGTTYR